MPVKLAMLILCVLMAVGVFATMFVAVCSSPRDRSQPSPTRQHLAIELIWAAIPCLMIVAAALPAVMTITSQGAGDSSRNLSGISLNGKPLTTERDPLLRVAGSVDAPK